MTGQKFNSPQDTYERNTRRAEIAGWLIVVGLTVELASLIVAGRPLSEVIPQAIADLLIGGGVGFELFFARTARVAGDSIQAEAHAEIAKARAQQAIAALALARLQRQVAPREIDREQFLAIIRQMTQRTPEIVFVKCHPDASDGFGTGSEITKLLVEAGWRVSGPEIMERDSQFLRFAPQIHITDGGARSGIAVIQSRKESLSGQPLETDSPLVALGFAITATLGSSGGHSDSSEDLQPGELAVLIFPR